jgi:hypothetical protein
MVSTHLFLKNMLLYVRAQTTDQTKSNAGTGITDFRRWTTEKPERSRYCMSITQSQTQPRLPHNRSRQSEIQKPSASLSGSRFFVVLSPLKNLYSRDFWFFLSRKRTTLRLHKSKIYSQLKDLRNLFWYFFPAKKYPKSPPP